MDIVGVKVLVEKVEVTTVIVGETLEGNVGVCVVLLTVPFVVVVVVGGGVVTLELEVELGVVVVVVGKEITGPVVVTKVVVVVCGVGVVPEAPGFKDEIDWLKDKHNE